mmetsp:Transcript_7579/g.19438  ORF Transcript_7579/g.19438 Transcript_7579/m.19438 type:complete len:258 (-) Transcript_7579:258-1031(-)
MSWMRLSSHFQLSFSEPEPRRPPPPAAAPPSALMPRRAAMSEPLGAAPPASIAAAPALPPADVTAPPTSSSTRTRTSTSWIFFSTSRRRSSCPAMMPAMRGETSPDCRSSGLMRPLREVGRQSPPCMSPGSGESLATAASRSSGVVPIVLAMTSTFRFVCLTCSPTSSIFSGSVGPPSVLDTPSEMASPGIPSDLLIRIKRSSMMRRRSAWDGAGRPAAAGAPAGAPTEAPAEAPAGAPLPLLPPASPAPSPASPEP